MVSFDDQRLSVATITASWLVESATILNKSCGNTMMPYLDYNATTPVDPIVLDKMLPLFQEHFGNPASTTHETGRLAADAVEEAREQIAGAVGCGKSDIIFTSGATEANNTVLFGLADAKSDRMILAGTTEHKSVLEACKRLEKDNVAVGYVPVDQDGVTDLAKLDMMLESDMVGLVSIMAANSETGVIQPAKAIAEIVHEHGALFHCDATQAIGKIPFNVQELGIDIATMSSHKIYGPKGCGAIIAMREVRRDLRPLIYGGGQENDMRSGTLNVPAIVGFGLACHMAATSWIRDAPRQRELRNYFEKEMTGKIDDVTINGINVERLPNTSNIRITGALADAVMTNARRVEISTGSACASSTMEPSHVLMAMGLDRTAADESLRVSLGRPTTIEEIKLTVDEIAKATKYVRTKEAEIPRRMV